MITNDKIIEIFCAKDEFSKKYEEEIDVNLVTGIRSNMKNKLMPLWDKIMLRKRYIIECINHLLKDKGNLVHSRHRSINNFQMNLIAAICAYCFFDNKPEAIKGYCVEDNKQLTLF